MNPIGMALLLTTGLGLFGVSALRRWQLLFAGATRPSRVNGSWRKRLQRTLRDGLLQSRVRREAGPGWAHSVVFLGFLVLLARTVTLFGRGFDREFNLWLLSSEPTLGLPLGSIYLLIKDACSLLVLAAVGYFILRRIWWKPSRLRLSKEAIVILGVIAALMISDQVYDGASLALLRDANASERLSGTANTVWQSPLNAAIAQLFRPSTPSTLKWLVHFGFWSHAVLVLGFLNWLPYSKHFHIITALPNLYFAPLEPPGKLPSVAETAEELLEKADQLQSMPEKRLTPLGISQIEDLSWKDRLDLFACTECGRCSEHCPATRTDKPLSPMQLTLDLRKNLLESGERLLAPNQGAGRDENRRLDEATSFIPQVIGTDTIWACTTCRACEEQCPVGIGYVEKIVSMRRELVLMRGEVPASLQRTFDGIERHGKPWQLSRDDRASWAKG